MNNQPTVPAPKEALKERGQRLGTTAALCSAVCFGLGQGYNRQYAKAILFFLVGVGGGLYFLKHLGPALWGLYTLGDTPTVQVAVDGVTRNVPGDHSIYIMLGGLIHLLAFGLYVWLYASNIRDAYRVGRNREAGYRVNTIIESLRFVRDFKFPQLILVLPAIGILFFTVLPILFMILIAFTNYSSPDHVPPAKLVDWVGFQTFRDLLTLKTWSHTLFGVFQWTIIWAVAATVTTYFGGFLVALIIQQKEIRFKSFWRTILIIPYAIPALISLLMMRNLFNAQFGPVNQMLGRLGIYQPHWLTDPTWAKVTVVLVNMWIGVPVSMILIMGSLTAIPRELYEAAEVEGATLLQKFRLVTLPLVLFMTAPVLIGSFAGNINNFNAIFLLTNGGPTVGHYQYAGATDLLVTWLYSLTLNQLKFNMASAIGILIFIFIASFSIWNYRRSRSYQEEDMIQ